MLKLEKTVTPSAEQWEAIIRGMRNPKNSWEKSDSCFCPHEPACEASCPMYIGPNDHSLMMKLRNAGKDHRKFMRQIIVYVDITAPLYWWKEFDTYKVGTVANSCSTMHKLHEKEFTVDDFAHEKLGSDGQEDFPEIPLILDPKDLESAYDPMDILGLTINMLNACRMKYLETWDARYFHMMVQLLPSSYMQKRTITMNYEVLANIYNSRKNHKLTEWRVDICEWIKTLPYSEIITGEENDG